ncbi:MAG: hypothetical protein GY861_17490 [bacterium]|nr:hypothetical protein [bacterium]
MVNYQASAVNGKIDVDATSTEVRGGNGNRKFLILVNDSDEVIYISLSATAAMNEGVRLNANGGTLIIGEEYNGPVSAICASGSKNLTFSAG